MLLQAPFAALTSAVDGDVLRALAADRSFTVAELSRLIPERSYPGVSNAVGRLVEQGVVLLERVGRARTVRLNREHLVADAVLAIASTRARFVERLRDACGELPVRYAALFGSAARGEMRVDSDIDLFFVRGEGVRDDEPVSQLMRRVTAWTGNDARPVIYDIDDLHPDDPLLQSVLREGIPLSPHGRWLHRHLRRIQS